MNNLIIVLLILMLLDLISYGIKAWFQYKLIQGQERSNITIRKAIQSLLFGFLALIGLTPWTTSLLVQLLNHIPGIELQNNSSNEFIGGIAYLFFCLSIALVVYLYYANRHRLYLSKNPTEATSNQSPTSINYHKNIVKNSEIKSGGNTHIGDQ